MKIYVKPLTSNRPRFCNSCQEIVEDFAERLEQGGEIDPEADWIPAEFEKATDLLLLLQFESGDAPLKDAISILAQLGDNLAWAGSTVAEAQSENRNLTLFPSRLSCIAAIRRVEESALYCFEFVDQHA